MLQGIHGARGPRRPPRPPHPRPGAAPPLLLAQPHVEAELRAARCGVSGGLGGGAQDRHATTAASAAAARRGGGARGRPAEEQGEGPRGGEVRVGEGARRDAVRPPGGPVAARGGASERARRGTEGGQRDGAAEGPAARRHGKPQGGGEVPQLRAERASPVPAGAPARAVQRGAGAVHQTEGRCQGDAAQGERELAGAVCADPADAGAEQVRGVVAAGSHQGGRRR
mmetsp:Transcript_23678/g.55080  ORF Transcript_23678/g.55080 Transcript_23678/m.55080 type:complete len:226 (-) Transcript_23678:735-1412(-)